MAPQCSIVIATYKQGDMLRDCLASLKEVLGPPGDLYEIILVVNGGQFQWANSLVDVLEDVRVIDSAINLGFAGGYNLGASYATGDYIVLLNDDTVVLPDWLSSMVRAAERNEAVGAIGSGNYSFDGHIEEVGSVLFSNGRTLGVGRGLPADSLEWDFVREVDFISASSMLLPRAAWEAVGGLDAAFHPAYYEDVDLCLRLREAGYRIYYEPRSKVMHHVSQSSDNDYKGMLIQHHQDQIITRWVNELRACLPSPHEEEEWPFFIERAAQRARRARSRVLLIDDLLPSPGVGAGFSRSLGMVEDLVAHGAAVTIKPTYARITQTTDLMRDLGVRVVADDLADFLARPDITFDTIVVSRQTNAKYLEVARALQPQASLIMDHESLYHIRLERQAALATTPEERARLTAMAEEAKEQEDAAMSFVDLNVCISEAEADYIRSRKGTAPAMVIAPQAGGIEPSPATLEGRRDMLFVAGWMAGPTSPNVDALAWFVDEVLPIIRSSVPWATVRVTGAAPPLNVRDMANDGVRILGYVHDLDVAYREARVVVAPIRFGAGVKLKTVEALEYGLPTVATVIGAEGIDVGAGNAGLVVADDPAAYAAACVTLLTDDAAWMRARAALADLQANWGRSSGATWTEAIRQSRFAHRPESAPALELVE